MKRAIIVVVDALGIGALPDAPEYNDLMECNTLCNVAKYNKGLDLPNFQKLGLGNIDNIEGVPPANKPLASYGKMMELSKGKDTTTGHWEIAGLILEDPFKTYPEGFPQEIIDEFIKRTGCKGILANKPASGTAIIDELGEKHAQTKYPIIYTSADSVFQIACNVDVIPLRTLYKWCETARELFNEKAKEHNVNRIIARPFESTEQGFQRISADRKDYSVPPHKPTVLDSIIEKGGRVLGIGKIEDIYLQKGISHAVHTGSNKEGIELTIKAVKSELNLDELKTESAQDNGNPCCELIFTNLVDTDMLYGHRNDAVGFANSLKEIDSYLPELMDSMQKDDLLIITADHGCDPTTPGTDHTREQVPLLVYNPELNGNDLETRKSFADIAASLSIWLDLSFNGVGSSFLSK